MDKRTVVRLVEQDIKANCSHLLVAICKSYTSFLLRQRTSHEPKAQISSGPRNQRGSESEWPGRDVRRRLNAKNEWGASFVARASIPRRGFDRRPLPLATWVRFIRNEKENPRAGERGFLSARHRLVLITGPGLVLHEASVRYKRPKK
ncbi:unnamed protein product [Notodromas monacha]|uniref:Uncharacterized protein n=1 Tax=Notodromas monacha TaxID=399045 RepID=A0A7R9BSG3_9CRUS|nr:unnamed protein product [Notodromas monacha]CAG0919506.1 unnamed protein product [Notodromas monacha]